MKSNDSSDELRVRIRELEEENRIIKNQNKQLQTELIGNKDWLNQIFETTNVGIWDINWYADEVFISESLFQFTGYQPQNFKVLAFRHFWNSLIVPEDLEKTKEIFQLLDNQQAESYSTEYRIKTKHGNELWVLEKGVVLSRNKKTKKVERIAGVTLPIDEKKNLEEILVESEEKFRILFESMLDGFMLFEVIYDNTSQKYDYFLLEMNQSVEKLTAFKKIHILDKSINTIYDGRYTFLQELLIDTYIKQQPQKINFFDKSTNKYLVFNAFIPQKDQIALKITDITEHKIAEQEISKSKKLLQDIIDNAQNVLISVRELDGKFIFVNKFFEKTVSINRQNVIGKSNIEIFSETIAKRLNDGMKKVVDRQKRIKEEEFFDLGDKSLHLLSTKFLLYDNNNKPYAYCKVGTDISELKRIERKLLFEKLKAQKYFNTAAVMLVVFDIELNVMLINQKGIDILEIDGYYVYKQNWIENFVDAHDVKRTKTFYQQLIEINSDGSDYIEYYIKSKKGNKKLIGCNNTLIRDEKGNIISILASGNDITELRRAEIELIKAKEKAVESDNLKTAFLANMSHEIRTPLNSIIGFTQILRTSLENDEQKQFIDIIQRSGNSLLLLINDIIDIAKIEAGQITINNYPVSLNALIDDVYTLFDTEIKLAEKEELTFTAYKDLKDIESQVFTDDARLKQILTNLLSNAVKFTQKGEIKFGYKLKNYQSVLFIEFFVEDTGIGLSKEKQEVIFKRFRQGDNSITRKFGGTGLGLAISKGILDLMGGQIWVESDPDKGAKFYFTIPYNKVEKKIESTESIKSSALQNWNWNEKIILIVEDDINNYNFLRVVLQKSNANVIHANTGVEAIRICNSIINIDLILMDMLLPELNGYEATRKIKEKRNIPIIAQTANAMLDDEDKCLAAGCDAYLAKPIDYKELFLTMDKFLNPTN